jgi:uncharacterized protein Usg
MCTRTSCKRRQQASSKLQHPRVRKHGVPKDKTITCNPPHISSFVHYWKTLIVASLHSVEWQCILIMNWKGSGRQRQLQGGIRVGAEYTVTAVAGSRCVCSRAVVAGVSSSQTAAICRQTIARHNTSMCVASHDHCVYVRTVSRSLRLCACRLTIIAFMCVASHRQHVYVRTISLSACLCAYHFTVSTSMCVPFHCQHVYVRTI